MSILELPSYKVFKILGIVIKVFKSKTEKLFFFGGGGDRLQWVMPSSFTRFLDHTQRQNKFSQQYSSKKRSFGLEIRSTKMYGVIFFC